MTRYIFWNTNEMARQFATQNSIFSSFSMGPGQIKIIMIYWFRFHRNYHTYKHRVYVYATRNETKNFVPWVLFLPENSEFWTTIILIYKRICHAIWPESCMHSHITLIPLRSIMHLVSVLKTDLHCRSAHSGVRNRTSNQLRPRTATICNMKMMYYRVHCHFTARDMLCSIRNFFLSVFVRCWDTGG